MKACAYVNGLTCIVLPIFDICFPVGSHNLAILGQKLRIIVLSALNSDEENFC